MKRIFSVIVISLSLLLLTAPAGKTKVESYYSGDAIYYNGQIIIGSVNSDSLELFVEGNSKINRITKLKPFDGQFGQEVNFSALKFSQEGGRLYVYATADYSIYKYDITTPSDPVLITKTRNTYWEWYNNVDKVNNEVITVSNNSVGIMNTALQNINAYTFPNNNAYNVNLDEAGLFIINNSNNYIQLYNRSNRSVSASWAVNYKAANINGNHRVYTDPLKNELFVIDDYFVKKFDLDGKLKNSFRHLDYPGYDAVPSGDGNSIYVSNGIGVMKLSRNELKLMNYKFTSSLVDLGGWAMGIKAVWTPSGEKLVVFNNSSILVLDKDLKNYSAFISTEESSQPEITETLFLNLDRNWGSVNDSVALNGGGFSSGETLSIDFSGAVTEVKADSRGRFSKILTVPGVTAGWTEIRIQGQESSLHYSINFEIK